MNISKIGVFFRMSNCFIAGYGFFLVVEVEEVYFLSISPVILANIAGGWRCRRRRALWFSWTGWVGWIGWDLPHCFLYYCLKSGELLLAEAGILVVIVRHCWIDRLTIAGWLPRTGLVTRIIRGLVIAGRLDTGHWHRACSRYWSVWSRCSASLGCWSWQWERVRWRREGKPAAEICRWWLWPETTWLRGVRLGRRRRTIRTTWLPGSRIGKAISVASSVFNELLNHSSKNRSAK